jgi:hypothetical protein
MVLNIGLCFFLAFLSQKIARKKPEKSQKKLAWLYSRHGEPHFKRLVTG